MSKVDEIRELLALCTSEERLQIFRILRSEFPIHPYEKTLNTKAEVILEAISKAPDLTIRGVRGILAEASFLVEVVAPLLSTGWRDVTPKGNLPYDCLIEDNKGTIRVQVKMQRLKNHRPMMASEGLRRLSEDKFVVETQRTRGGKDPTGGNTRPYRFGEFDILAVSLHPSTNDWRDFRYTVAGWLLPDPAIRKNMLKFQPVAQKPNTDWTSEFLEAVRWFRSGKRKRIST